MQSLKGGFKHITDKLNIEHYAQGFALNSWRTLLNFEPSQLKTLWHLDALVTTISGQP